LLWEATYDRREKKRRARKRIYCSPFRQSFPSHLARRFFYARREDGLSEAKTYFYLKLKENFFERPEIKAIEGMQSGYEYICIIQKMYLRSLSREGKLMLTDTVPYDIKLLASVLGHKQETIKAAVEIFRQLGLVEILSDKSIYMLEIQNFIGESSTEADRIREYRKSIAQAKELVQLNDINTDICTPELELELKQEIESKKENTAVAPVKTGRKKVKEPRSEEERDAFTKVFAAFQRKYGTFEPGISKIESIHIWGLIDKARSRDPTHWFDFLKAVISTFWKIKQNRGDFLSKQPFLPSALNSKGIWPRVLEVMRTETPKELTEAEILNTSKEAVL
jgi:predicted phage replisome organizer